MVNQFDKATSKVSRLEEKLVKLKTTQIPTAEYRELEASIKKQTTEYEKQIAKYKELVAKQEEMKANNKTFGSDWEKINNQIAEMDSKLSEMGIKLDNNKYRLQEMVDSGKGFTLNEKEIKSTEEQLRQARNQAEIYGQKLNEAEEKQRQLASTAGQMGKNIKGAFSETHKSLSSSIGSVNKFGKRVAGLAKRVFVFGLITAALRSIRDEIGNILGTDADVKRYCTQIKGNLKIAFGSLFNAVLPALKVILSYFAQLTNYIATFVTRLFGGADAAKKLAANMGSAAESANEVKRATTGIDELNTLGSSGSDNSTLEYINNWEMDSNGFINEMADAIRNGDWTAVAEGMSDLLNNALGNITRFLKKINWKKLGQSIGKFISGIKWGDIAINMLELANAIIEALIDAFLGFAEEAPLAALALAVMGTLKLLKFSPKAAPITNMAGKFASTVMAAIGAAVGGFAAGRGFWSKYIAEDGDEWITQMGLMDTINYLLEDTDSLKEGFSMLWDDMVEGFSLSWDTFTTFLSDTWVGEAVWSVSNALSDFWDGVKDAFNPSSVTENLEERLTGTIDGLASDNTFWSNLSNSKFWPEFKNKIEKLFGVSLEGIDFSDPATEGIRKSILQARISGDWGLVAKAVADYNNQLAGQFGGNFNTDKHKKIIGAYIANTVADAIGTVNVGSKYVSSTLGNLVSTKLTPTSKFPTMPALASGAVIPPNKEFMAILGDQKQGVNIEAPLDTIVEAFNKAKGGGGNTTVIAQVNSRTLFEIFIDEYGKVVDETGKDPIIGI